MQTKIHKTTIKALVLAVMTVYCGHAAAAATKTAGKSIPGTTGTDQGEKGDYRQYQKLDFDTKHDKDGDDIAEKCAGASTGKCFDLQKSLEAALGSDDYPKFAAKKTADTPDKGSDDSAYHEACSSGDCSAGYDEDGVFRNQYGKKKVLNPGDPGFKKIYLSAGGNPWHDVGSGEKDTDAANIGDVKKMTAGLSDSITKNTSDIKKLDKRTTDLEKTTKELDAKVNQLQSDIRKVDKRASRGIASAMASAALNLASQPGEYAIAVGTATYRGEGSLAVGASMRSADGHWGTNASVNLNNDYLGATLSVGYHW